MSQVMLFAAMISVAVYAISFKAGKSYPEWARNTISTTVFAVTILATYAAITMFPISTPLAFVGVGLALLASVPPLAGYWESKYGKHGAAIGFVGTDGRPGGRFTMHLITNLAGAATATFLIYATSQVPGVAAFIDAPDSTAILVNVLLPLVGLVILAFVRSQQVFAERDIDSRVASGADWPPSSVGMSLRTWNQATNVVFLVVVTYLCVAGAFLMLAMSVSGARTGHPLEFSPWLALAVVASLVFFISCGLPPQRDDNAMYLTFATGTPVALGATLLMCALMEDSTARDVFAIALLLAGYSAYAIVMVLREKAAKAMLSETSSPSNTHSGWDGAHYFASVAVGAVLLSLLLVLYVI